VLAGLGAVAAAQTSGQPRLMAQVASGEVIACAYSSHGSAVLTGGREGVARLWDAATGEELQAFPAEAWIRHVALTADDRRVLAVSELDGRTTVQLWDEVSGKELGRLSPAGKPIYGLASPDGGTLATAALVNTDEQGIQLPPPGATKIQLWNLLTGKEIRHFLVPGADAVGVHSALSPDGSKLFTGDFNGPAVWNLETGKLLRRFEDHSEVVSAAAFSADGRRVVWGTYPGTVRLWNLDTGKEMQHFSADSEGNFMGALGSVAISQDGRRLLAASNEGNARVWDVETGKELQRFAASSPGTNRTVNCAAFSPDGSGVLTASDDQTARLWDVQSGRELHRLIGAGDAVAALAFAADGRGIVAVSRTGRAWQWDAESGKALSRSLRSAPEGAAPATGPDDKNVAGQPHARGYDGQYVPVVVISPDGRRVLLSGFRDGGGVWDLQTGKSFRDFEWHAEWSFMSADFSPDGRTLLATTGGLFASLWEVETGKELKRLVVNPGWRPRLLYPEGDYRAAVARVALSPDGRRAITSDSEGSTRLFDLKTGKEIRSFKVHTWELQSTGFSPDGSKMLAENPDGSASLREVETGKELRRFGKSSRPSFSADGGRLLMGFSLWDVASGKELRHFAAPQGTQPFATLSPDGRRVLIGSTDGVTQLWDVETGKELATLNSFRDGAWAVADPEGHFDTSDPRGDLPLHWIVDTDPLRPVPLETFARGRYTPGLLARILKGEALAPIRTAAEGAN